MISVYMSPMIFRRQLFGKSVWPLLKVWEMEPFFYCEIYILFISCFCVSKMLKCKLISTRHTRGSLVDDTYAQGDVYMCSVEAILWTVVVMLRFLY